MSFVEKLATSVYEASHALAHASQLRECSVLIANPPNPLSPYENAILKEEESVSWKLWLASFGTYVGTHYMITRTSTFRNRPFIPQFIAVVPAMALILAGGALFRQRTLERLVDPPPGAQKDSHLGPELKKLYVFPGDE
jgi:hypothetical protein